MGTVTTGCGSVWALCACKAAPKGLAGPSHLQFPFGNTCALALALVLSRDPKPGSFTWERRAGLWDFFWQWSWEWQALPAEINNGGYPTVSASVGFRSQEQSKLFSFNGYRVLPAYALIGLNSLCMALARLHITLGQESLDSP